MGAKEAFFGEFLTDLPEGLAAALEKPIPAMSVTSLPNSEEDAIIVQGVLAHNLNVILQTLEGVPLAAIPLYIGQLNTVNQCLLGAALEVAGGTGDFKILAPVDGSSWFGHFGVTTLYGIEVLRGDVESISATLGGASSNDNETFDLVFSEELGAWAAEWPTPIGEHRVNFTAHFQDKTLTQKAANFSVRRYATFPVGGETLSHIDVLELHAPEEEIENAKADIIGRDGPLTTVDLQWSANRMLFEGEIGDLSAHFEGVMGEKVSLGVEFRYFSVGVEFTQGQVDFDFTL